MSFDLIPASTQYITFPVTPINIAEGTFCGWFAPDFEPAGTTQYYFWCTTTWVFSFRKYTDTNKCIVHVDGRQSLATVTGLWTSGSWTHFAAVYKKTGSILQLYVNGVAATMAAQSGTWGTTSPTSTINLGVYNDGALSPFDGDVAEFAIHNRMLTQTEITRISLGEPACDVGGTACTLYAPLLNTTRSAVGPDGTRVNFPQPSVHPTKPQHFRELADVLRESYDPAKQALRVANLGAASLSKGTFETMEQIFKRSFDPGTKAMRIVT